MMTDARLPGQPRKLHVNESILPQGRRKKIKQPRGHKFFKHQATLTKRQREVRRRLSGRRKAWRFWKSPEVKADAD